MSFLIRSRKRSACHHTTGKKQRERNQASNHDEQRGYWDLDLYNIREATQNTVSESGHHAAEVEQTGNQGNQCHRDEFTDYDFSFRGRACQNRFERSPLFFAGCHIDSRIHRTDEYHKHHEHRQQTSDQKTAHFPL